MGTVGLVDNFPSTARENESGDSMWKVAYIPADFSATVYALHEAENCTEAGKYIRQGREILRVLRRGPRMPSAPVMEQWKRSLKSFKRVCKKP